jgi:exonuclease VII large subunit
MRILLTTLVLLICCFAGAQTPIKLDEISRHTGDSIVVCGKVAGMRYFENSRNQPTFLNMGADFPNQQVTVVIWGDMRKQFAESLEALKGKDICITGRITLYKDRPQIVIHDPGQVRIQ